MFEAATSAFGNGVPGATPPATPSAEGSKDEEINDLKAQLAALNAKIDKLS
jgi:polyhydroxyalkanoate synthesis regulator protein